MIARASARCEPGRGQRGAVAADAAAEPVAHDRALGCEHRLRVDRLLASEDGPLEQGRRRRLAVAGQRGGASDLALQDPHRPERAAHARGERQLTLGERGVEARPRERGAVAEAWVARPEPDAGGGRLVGIVARGRERRPAPRPDALRPELARHLLRRERLELDDLEPGRGGLQPLAAAFARRRLELQLERDAARGDPDLRRSGRRGRACPAASNGSRARAPSGVEALGPRRGEVDLPEEDRRLRDLPPPGAASPPVYGGFAIESAVVAPSAFSARRNARTFARYCAVVSVHGVGVCAPKSSFSAISGVCSRSPTRRSRTPSGLAGDRRRVGRGARRADPLVQVQVEEDGRRARRRGTAPAASVPEDSASMRPGFGTIGALWPAKSTHSGPFDGRPHPAETSARR